MQVPYYFIADFEVMLITLLSQALDVLKKTKKVQEHIPCSFSYTKIRYDGVSEASKMYVGKNAEIKFVTNITREAFQIREEYKDPKPMLSLTAQEQRRYDNATYCWVELLTGQVRSGQLPYLTRSCRSGRVTGQNGSDGS